jgi:sugar phosphate isomerase/epimerase
LLAAAELGVQAVEINARTELRPGELTRTGVRHIRKVLADLNLRVCSIHFPTRRGMGEPADLEKRLDAAKAAMSMAHELGASVVVSSLGPLPQAGDASARAVVLQALSDLGRHGNRVGAWFAARTGIDPGERLAELIAELPAGTLGVDLDPGSLVMEGHSPETAMRRLADQVVSFRAFDAVRDASGRGMHVQLGRGSVDFPLMFAIGRATRVSQDAARGTILRIRRNWVPRNAGQSPQNNHG